jgi:hypothetical protein
VALALQPPHATADGSGRAAPQQLAAIPSPLDTSTTYLSLYGVKSVSNVMWLIKTRHINPNFPST